MYQENNITVNDVNSHSIYEYHMVLQSGSKETDAFLNRLEADGTLPLTVTWFGIDGFSNRLYHVQNKEISNGPFDICIGNLRLTMSEGSIYLLLMLAVAATSPTFKWVTGRSFNDMHSAQLPSPILGCLFFLSHFTCLDQGRKPAFNLGCSMGSG
jgi:hypothetical protein